MIGCFDGLELSVGIRGGRFEYDPPNSWGRILRAKPGSGLIKSAMQEWRRGKQRRGSCARICHRGDAPEILEPAEGAFDISAELVETLVKGERLSPGNDRLSPALMQFGTQLGAVVGLVAEHVFRWLHPVEQEVGGSSPPNCTSNPHKCFCCSK